jgi:hypothetical protein
VTFLPIVERELRVAARRRGTFWTRIIAAVLALVIASGVLLLAQLGRRGGGTSFGLALFQILGWLCFVFAASAGIVLTADCLSEERREGTLGLLFLTDLRGHDVVLGKLLATSLWAAYGLLAVFPVLALSFLLGGISGGYFWRHVLAVGNTLFFSLAVGLWVSSMSRESQKAMSGALLVCLVFTLGLPLIDWSIAGWDIRKFVPRFSLASPLEACLEANSGRSAYWGSLAVLHAVSWGFLAWSCRHVRRRLDESGAVWSAAPRSFARRWRYGAPAWREAWRRRLLDRNPIAWLASRDLWLRRVVGWVIVLGFALSMVMPILIARVVGAAGFSEWAVVIQIVSGVLSLALALWVVVQASRFFVEGVQTRALERILVTPVSVEAILQGHWAGLRRAFLFPAVILLVMKGCAGALQIYEFWQMSRNQTAGANLPFDFFTYQMVSVGFGLVLFVTSLLALAWFGMWMGLTSRKVPVAVIKTVVFVKILPWFVFAFGQGLLMMTIALAQWPSWIPAVLLGVLAGGLDVFFILFARAQLRVRMREVVTQADRPGRRIRPLPSSVGGQLAGSGARPAPESAAVPAALWRPEP